METNKFFILVLAILYISPLILFSQEDISVNFSFNKPNEFVCEIRNIIGYQVSILLSKEEPEGHSDLYFDIVKCGNDTIRNVYYGLMRDVNNQNQVLRLDPGQIYTISYREGYEWRFIEARVLVKYYKEIPNNKVKFHRKTFDLREVRNMVNTSQVSRE